MKKVITAIGNPKLNEKLKQEENIEIIGTDIQYQEGIFELLEKEKDIQILIISEFIQGEIPIEKIITKIISINNNIKIIVILENKKEELEKRLLTKGVNKIIYNDEIEIQDLIYLVNQLENNESKKIKQEINNFKKVVIQEQDKNKKQNKGKQEIQQNRTNEEKVKFEVVKNKKKSNKINLFSKKQKIEIKRNTEVISISGPSGTGKSIISVNLAKAIMYKKEKILIIDFDILNNSLHTILGVRRNPMKIDKFRINEIKIENLITKVNRKIDLFSAPKLLFFAEEKIDTDKIKEIIYYLKSSYTTIIIDTSSECFFDLTKTIINLSDKNIFVTETNILEIKKAKELLNIYVNTWKINKNKFNILFNKYDKECISSSLLKELFCEFNIIGTLKYNAKYNRLINKNIRNNFADKKIRNEYITVKKSLTKKKM